MKPRYIHDCDTCKFLGTEGKYDLYVCGYTYLARFGNKPQEYLAERSYRPGEPILKEAQRRAAQEGSETK